MSTILLISPEPWDGHFVSKHHYAIELAKRGHDVLFHGPPQAGGRVRIDAVEQQGARLGVVHAPQVAPGLRFLPARLRNTIEARWLRHLERLVAKRIDVVWLFENSRFFDMRFAGDRLRIYHQVDLNQNFHPEMAAATADLCIAVSRPIAERLEPLAKRLIRITHGYAEPADGRPDHDLPRPREDAAVQAMLIGNLDIPYLDIPLLAELVHRNPDVRFHFVGRYAPENRLHEALNAAPNAVFWGPRPAEALPAILEQADVLLVAYLAEKHLEQLANPHKIMEYLASGRAVLATRTLEYEENAGLVDIAPDRASYLTLFRKIVDNLPLWNAPDRMARRRTFALNHTYDLQLDRIAAALGEHGSILASTSARKLTPGAIHCADGAHHAAGGLSMHQRSRSDGTQG